MSKFGDRGCLGADKGSDLLNGNKSGKADRYKLYRRLFSSEHIFRTVLYSLVNFLCFILYLAIFARILYSTILDKNNSTTIHVDYDIKTI